jgi:hypothetical protein
VSITSEYRTTRALQICIVFVTTLAIERLLNYSRAGWIGFIVMMIYVGFDAGASIHRTMHRFWGSLLGLLLSYFLWQLGLLDYRVMLIVIPAVIFFAFFSLCRFYAYPTIFTVTLTFLGTAYFSPLDYDAYYFFFDYFKSTVVAFFICFVFEGLIFRSSHLTKKFYNDLQNSIIDELEQLYHLGIKQPSNQNHFLRGSATCRVKINELHIFEQTAKHDLGLKQGLGNTKSFHTLVSRALHDIRLLFLLSQDAPASLADAIQEMLHTLKTVLRQEGL